MHAGQPHLEWKGIKVLQYLHPLDSLAQTRLSQQSIKIIGQAMHKVGSPAGSRKERAEWCCGMCLHRTPCLDQQKTIKTTEWATNTYQAVVLESRVESTELCRTSLQGCPTWPRRTGKPTGLGSPDRTSSFWTGHTLGTVHAHPDSNEPDKTTWYTVYTEVIFTQDHFSRLGKIATSSNLQEQTQESPTKWGIEKYALN